MIRVGMAVIVLLLGSALIVGVTGHAEFADAPSDALEKASAIVVLGGEHDGREQYALSLARRGFADTILMSDPYRSTDADMRRFCATEITGVEIICRRPSPSSTRGEAMMANELARARGWQRIIVISWQFHLPRARLVFAQCYSERAGSAIFRAVPRKYGYSLLRWEYTYAYQYLAFAKAELQGPCQQP